MLYFASPFFQAALSGDWAETGRPASMSSVITISQPPVVLGDKRRSDAPTEMIFAPMDPDIDPEELDIDLGESSDAEASDSSQAILLTQDDERPNVEMSAEPKKKPGTMKERGNRASATKVVVEVQPEEKETARKESLDKLQGGGPRPTVFVPPEPPKANEKGKARAKNGQTVRLSWKKGATEAAVRRRQKVNGPDAVIVLKEEKVCTIIVSIVYHFGLNFDNRRAPSMTSSISCILGKNNDAPFELSFRDILINFMIAWNALSHGTTLRVS